MLSESLMAVVYKKLLACSGFNIPQFSQSFTKAFWATSSARSASRNLNTKKFLRVLKCAVNTDLKTASEQRHNWSFFSGISLPPKIRYHTFFVQEHVATGNLI
jgi:hypothetical protein